MLSQALLDDISSRRGLAGIVYRNIASAKDVHEVRPAIIGELTAFLEGDPECEFICSMVAVAVGEQMANAFRHGDGSVSYVAYGIVDQEFIVVVVNSVLLEEPVSISGDLYRDGQRGEQVTEGLLLDIGVLGERVEFSKALPPVGFPGEAIVTFQFKLAA